MPVMREYKAVPGSGLSDVQAKKYGKFLARKGMDRGPVDAPAIVNLARPSRSPIHEAFEWDDGRAAEAHRQEQARHLARSILVIRHEANGAERPTRAFQYAVVQETDEARADRGYVAQHVVWATPDLAAQVVARAYRELRAWRERYGEYSELQRALMLVGEALEEDAA